MTYIYAAIAAVIFALGTALGIKIHATMDAAQHARELEQAHKEAARRVERVDNAAIQHEKFKAATDARERTVIQEVERVVQVPVYRNECFDADGLRILAADIAARSAASEPAPAVPGASAPAAHGWRVPFSMGATSDRPL